jgi:uncharacterized Zn finger protein
MTTIPTITEEDVRDLVGEGSFQRGQRYFRDNRIFDTRRAGMTLKAKCEGSRSTPYRVEVTIDNTGITDTDCSCPVGGYCKHVVALLLTWLAEPDEFIEQQDIDTLLQQCEKDELITLIKQMLRRDPDLEYLLTTISKPGTPIDPQIYRNQVEMAYRNAGDEWGAASEIADELLAIMETADSFAERHDYASATALYNAIVTGVIDHHYEYQHQDEEGEIDEVITECTGGLKQCLDEVQEDSALREQILRILFAIYRFNVEAGGIGFGEDAPEILLEDTTDEERRTIASWVREASHLNELLTQVDLDEDDTNEIIKMVQATGSPIVNDASNRIVALVQAAEETQPDVVLNFYLRYVAYLIDYRNRRAYEEASRILIRMRSLYEKLGKNEAWIRYIKRLHEKHRALKALQSVLATAGL